MKGFLRVTTGLLSLGLLAACSKGQNLNPRVDETKLRAMCKSPKAFDLENENAKRMKVLSVDAGAVLRTTLERDEILGLCAAMTPVNQKAINNVVLPMNATSAQSIDVLMLEKDCENLTARLVLPNGALEVRGQIKSIAMDSIEIDDGQLSFKVEKVFPEKYNNVTQHGVSGFRKSVRPEYSYAKMMDEQGFNSIKLTVKPNNFPRAKGVEIPMTVLVQQTAPANAQSAAAVHPSVHSCQPLPLPVGQTADESQGESADQVTGEIDQDQGVEASQGEAADVSTETNEPAEDQSGDGTGESDESEDDGNTDEDLSAGDHDEDDVYDQDASN